MESWNEILTEFVEFRTPAPPEAKLTPVRNTEVLFDLEERERYGGDVSKPRF
jgi:hypothetical protein